MSVSHDRRPDVTAGTRSGSVVVGGWLLAIAAVAAFTFTTGDALHDEHDAVLVSKSGVSFHQALSATGSAARRSSPRIVDTGLDEVAAPPPGTASTPDSHDSHDRTCGTRASTSTTGSVQRVGNRERTSRSTHIRSGAGISKISASACRLSSSPKLHTNGVSHAIPGRAAGAARPVPMEPAAN